jgi:hypothetical protein
MNRLNMEVEITNLELYRKNNLNRLINELRGDKIDIHRFLDKHLQDTQSYLILKEDLENKIVKQECVNNQYQDYYPIYS